MKLKQLAALACLTALSAVAPGCSSGDDGGSGTAKGKVGDACSTDSDCAGYTNPKCVTAIYPTKNLITDPTDPSAKTFEELEIPFTGGYCTNDLGELTADDLTNKSCTADSCGEGGECFAPLGSFEDLSGLEQALPFVNIQAFGAMALCLKPCTSNTDCRTDEGYVCTIPLMGLLNTLGETKTFCMVDKDYSALLGGGGG